jgi:NADH-quinone oxidoreductase subunit L
MPITFVTFGLGYLALIGFPFLSGYYSKDAIIEAAAAQPGWRGLVMGGLAMLAAGLTAFYMTRLVFMTFFGEKRWQKLKAPDGHDYHPHESPASMTVPMIILAFGSVFAGYLLTQSHTLAGWLAPTLGELEELHGGALPESAVAVGTLVLSGLGVLIAYLLVGRRPTPVQRPEPVAWPVQAARRDLYANAINEALVARPGTWLARALVFVDNKGVDGIVNGMAALLGGTSGRMRRMQTGFVRSYALSMLGGGVLLIAALLAVRFGTQ